MTMCRIKIYSLLSMHPFVIDGFTIDEEHPDLHELKQYLVEMTNIDLSTRLYTFGTSYIFDQIVCLII
jgi:hypothetical protein